MSVISKGESDKQESFERVRAWRQRRWECHILPTFTAIKVEFHQYIRVGVYYANAKFQIHVYFSN